MRRLVVYLALGALVVMLTPELAHATPDAACGNAFDDTLDKGWLWLFLGAFGAGLITSATPCVYPMIPITLAIFGARGEDVSRRRALALATVYICGMGLTYAAFGVIIALLGKTGSFGTQLASPYVVIPLVVLFTALAASLFGAFNLQLPASLQLKLNQVGGKGFGGAGAMGLVGGLIAAPCTGPFLLGLLTFVATTHDVFAGGALLFVYALGIGVPFWVLAAFARSLPRSGAWMEYAKSVGGCLLLFAAIYYLRPLIPAIADLASPELWFGGGMLGAIATGVALGAIHRSFHGGVGERVRKAVGVVLVVGGASGAWLWHDAPKQHLPYIYGDEKLAFETARKEGKGVMVDFGASWCGPCRDIDRTFGYDEIHDAVVADFVPLKFDVSEPSDSNEQLKAKYGAYGLPNVVFVRADASPLLHVTGEVTAATKLGSIVRRIVGGRAARRSHRQVRLIGLRASGFGLHGSKLDLDRSRLPETCPCRSSICPH